MKSEKKKRKLEENICVSRAAAKAVRLTNVDVSNLMVRQGITFEFGMSTCAGWQAGKALF